MSPEDLEHFGLGLAQVRAIRTIGSGCRALHEGLRELDALCPGRRFGNLAHCALLATELDPFDPRAASLLDGLRTALEREIMECATSWPST